MRDVPLAEMTRWKIGGPAPLFARAGSLSELRDLLAELDAERVWVLGHGANLLVSDDGPDGPVVVLLGDFKAFRMGEATIRFGAATPIAAVVQEARRKARSGLWILEAVPGTMGGALRMNAGTAEEGIWERVRSARAIWPNGAIRRLTREDVKPSYRKIELDAAAIIVGGELEAPPGDAERIGEEHRRRRDGKLAAQVYDLPSCGSTWKNPQPPAPSAWELVDEVGMRGARRGGAQISEKHANFIVNLGDARADDIVGLMLETRRRVRERRGIELEPEIEFWGFPRNLLNQLGVRG